MISTGYATWIYRILVLVAIGLSVWWLAAQYVDRQMNRIQTNVLLTHSALEEELRRIVSASPREMADWNPSLRPLVDACPADAQSLFDRGLANLDSIDSSAEIQALLSYFDRCATQFAHVQLARGLLVRSLLPSYEMVTDLLHEAESLEMVVEDWTTYADIVTELGLVYVSLYEIQRELIELRGKGATGSDESVRTLLSNVTAKREGAEVLRQQEQLLRTRLIDKP